MTDAFVFEAPPQPPVGTHPGICTKVGPTEIETQEGAKTLIRWEFTITTKAGEDIPVDALSSMNYGPRSKARKWAAALGVDPKSDTARPDQMEGQPCLVVIAEGDDGYAKIQDVVAAPK